MTKIVFFVNLLRMSKIQKKEKRTYLRLNVYHLVKYRLASESPSHLITASIRDIGGGGICLQTEKELSVPSLVHLYINFPGLSRSIPSLAKVVWVRKLKKTNLYRAGIQFLDIQDVLRNEIIKEVESVFKKARKN